MSVNQAIQWLQRDSSTSKITDAEIANLKTHGDALAAAVAANTGT